MCLQSKRKIILQNITTKYQCIMTKIGKKNWILKNNKNSIQKVVKKYKKCEICSFISFIEEYKMIPK